LICLHVSRKVLFFILYFLSLRLSILNLLPLVSFHNRMKKESIYRLERSLQNSLLNIAKRKIVWCWKLVSLRCSIWFTSDLVNFTERAELLRCLDKTPSPSFPYQLLEVIMWCYRQAIETIRKGILTFPLFFFKESVSELTREKMKYSINYACIF